MQQLANWTDKDGTGIEIDSSAGFILLNGATRSPRWRKPSDLAARGNGRECVRLVGLD